MIVCCFQQILKQLSFIQSDKQLMMPEIKVSPAWKASNSGDFDGSNQFPFCIAACRLNGGTEREIPKWPFVYKCDFARANEQSKFALVKSDFSHICAIPLILIPSLFSSLHFLIRE